MTFLLGRVGFGALSGQLQAELFKSEDICGKLSASQVFEEYSSREGRSRRGGTDKAAARKMTPQCFNALKDLRSVNVGYRLSDWPDKLFASVTHSLDPNFLIHATGKQIESFGADVKKEDEEHACAHLRPESIPAKHYQHIRPACFRSWVASQEGNVSSLGESVGKLPVTTLAELGGELIGELSVDDLANFRAEHWQEFMKKDGACAAIPETAAQALFPTNSNDETAEHGHGKRSGRRLIPDARCMAKLHPALQKAAVKTVSSAMPADALSMIDSEALSAWSENPFGILNRVRNGALLTGLGSQIGQGRAHPCRALSSKLLVTLPHFAQHMHPDCAAVITDLDSIENAELKKMPLAVISQLPLARMRLARDFKLFSAKDVEILSQSSNFCNVLDHDSFLTTPSRLVQPSPSCIVSWKFIGSLTQADLESLPGDAFAMFDAESIQPLASIPWMSPTQFGAMGSKCPAGKAHPAAVIGADMIALLTPEQIGTLTSTHIAAIPAKSYSGLSTQQVTAIPPAALVTITFAQVSAMSDTAFGGFKAVHFSRFGEANRASPDAIP